MLLKLSTEQAIGMFAVLVFFVLLVSKHLYKFYNVASTDLRIL